MGDWRPPKIKFHGDYDYDNMNRCAIIIGSIWGALITFAIVIIINHNTDCLNCCSNKKLDNSDQRACNDIEIK